ncbi:Flp pilus assembly pilin Flp [Lipingzhangella halophila]|uniref:Flp pilus assembly pilin Flp n=1 Tax=Lipingzhangella halophila TaxID=1783352 RepID=A0A7W7W6M5_9ACTN|nr:C2 family cysteine protease [Lipingzhangella halophila]MBB4934995.1 Flp pilus assembly pilin Flp [Lipingzhangella halophila]
MLLRIQDSERGASFTEYAAVILLVSMVAGVVLVSGAASAVGGLLTNALCRVGATGGSSADCEEVSSTDTADSPSTPDGVFTPNPAADPRDNDEGADRRGNVDGSGSQAAPWSEITEPSEEDYEAAADELAEIREYYENPEEHETSLNPLTWFGNTDPARALSRMPQNELDALLWSLEEDEIATMLGDSELREVIMSEAGLDTLRMIRELDQSLIEADTSGTVVRTPSWLTDDLQATYYGDDATFEEGPQESLWGDDGEPTLDDIQQGSLGDCWLLAAAGALVHNDPGAIEDMIEENDNGTFTVTFSDTGEEITVTPDLPSYGGPIYADPGDDNVLWPAILEKALAEREGGYEELHGGLGDTALQTLTGDGRHVENFTPDDLEDWSDGGAPIVVSTQAGRGSLYRPEGDLVSYHAYTVTNVEDGMVELHNPWGYNHPDPVPIEELQEQSPYGIYLNS